MNSDSLREFQSFLDREVESARAELEPLNEKSRRHLQKLVFTNLVDRFDSTIDSFLLNNAYNDVLLSEALGRLAEPLPEGEVLRLFADTSKASVHVETRVKDTLRESVLRERHSKKLFKALQVFAGLDDKDRLKPRVNQNEGRIYSRISPPNNKIPCSIPGYADWLYSRRNAVVHGGGRASMLKNDLDQLRKLYKCDPGLTVNLSLASIRNAATYYYDVSNLLLSAEIKT